MHQEAVGWQVVPALLDDAEQVASVQVQAWREAYGELLPERFYDAAARARRQAMWSRILSEEDAGDRVRVARREGHLVGFASRGRAAAHGGHPPPREEQLYALYVLARWYGSGIGQALLDQCLGGRPAQLWVARDNARARRFYERNGFRCDGTELVDEELDGLVEIRMLR